MPTTIEFPPPANGYYDLNSRDLGNAFCLEIKTDGATVNLYFADQRAAAGFAERLHSWATRPIHAATALKYFEVPPEAQQPHVPRHERINQMRRECEHSWHRFGEVNGVPDIGCQLCGATKPT